MSVSVHSLNPIPVLQGSSSSSVLARIFYPMSESRNQIDSLNQQIMIKGIGLQHILDRVSTIQ